MFNALSERPAFCLKFIRARFLILALTFFFCCAAAENVSAATFLVDSTSDASLTACTVQFFGDCSLRGAIERANANSDEDTIEFFLALFGSPQTITLATVLPTISNPVTISGPGARLLTVRRDVANASSFTILFVSNTTATISGITVTGGSNGGGINNNVGALTLDRVRVTGNLPTIGSGAGIANFNGGSLTITNSLIDNNRGTNGGIFGGGTMTIANTTIHSNQSLTTSGLSGAGIDSRETLNLNNVTVTDNSSGSTNAGATGGVLIVIGTANVRNTIISRNRAASLRDDVSGDFVSNGNNFIGNPIGSSGFTQATDITNQLDGLGALQNNGGDTDTRLPSLNPTLLNKGNNCVVNQSCAVNNPPVPLTFDQRGIGFVRRSSVAVDIGAAELQNPTAAGASVGGAVKDANGRGIFRARVLMTDAAGNQREAFTNQLGFYNFEDVAGGQTYIFTAFHRRYQFDQPNQVQFIGEATDGINFVGTQSGIFRFDIWNLPIKADN